MRETEKGDEKKRKIRRGQKWSPAGGVKRKEYGLSH
jgi:hypothetical protein